MQQTPKPQLKETRSRGSSNFLCAVYQSAFSRKESVVKYHWHEEVEILYFAGGSYLLEINMESFIIEEECFYFIQPGELHQVSTLGTCNAAEDAIVFDLGIMRFDNVDAAAMQVISPICSGNLVFPRCIPKEDPAFLPVRNTFSEILDSLGLILVPEQVEYQEKFADTAVRQLLVKSGLLKILAILFEHNLLRTAQPGYDRRIESIKKALSYIYANFQDKIYIRDLAELVGMNEQYFCRFFKKAIGRSPMEFINEYRIRKALQLLEETDLSVTEICLECGFHNLGNFMREFRKITQMTPLKYRKSHSCEDQSHE
jgi:AraC-like DNA-binding protein/quercetin dioxygenase-like cupin family protein